MAGYIFKTTWKAIKTLFKAVIFTAPIIRNLIISFPIIILLGSFIADFFSKRTAFDTMSSFNMIFKTINFLAYLIILYFIFKMAFNSERKKYYISFILFYIILITLDYSKEFVNFAISNCSRNIYHILRIGYYSANSLEKAIMVSIIYDSSRSISERKRKKYAVDFDGIEHMVCGAEISYNRYEIIINDTEYDVELQKEKASNFLLQLICRQLKRIKTRLQ